MAIGTNWAEVWDPVWDSVWDQPSSTLAACINWKPVWKAAWGPVWQQAASTPPVAATPSASSISQLDGRRYEWIFRDDEDICFILAAVADSLCLD